MACLIAPAAVLIVTKNLEKKLPSSLHIEWLNWMLAGGTIMLLIDHVRNGEIVPYFPFFTAGYRTIFKEIWHNGVPMVLAVLGVWLISILIDYLQRKHRPTVLSREATSN